MRTRILTLAIVLVAIAVITAGCGSDDNGSQAAATGSTATTATTTTTTAAATSADDGLPTVTGTFGESATVTLPGPDPGDYSATVLTEGTGPEVAVGDMLVAHYLGQTWRDGQVFDQSFARGEPATFPIGVGQVIPGWDEGLVGKKVGSRVLLVLPPDKGYGPQGNPQAGIQGTDTLVFVVDIIGS